MYEFECGHEECGSRLRAPDKSLLMLQVAEHLRTEHKVAKPTKALLSYLEVTCVKESTSNPVR